MARPSGHLKPIGRPGEGRALHGRIRATVLPKVKAECEEIVAQDGRLGSLSRLVELAMTVYAERYREAKGVLDHRGFPVIR
jgi:hypothetical protein